MLRLILRVCRRQWMWKELRFDDDHGSFSNSMILTFVLEVCQRQWMGKQLGFDDKWMWKELRFDDDHGSFSNSMILTFVLEVCQRQWMGKQLGFDDNDGVFSNWIILTLVLEVCEQEWRGIECTSMMVIGLLRIGWSWYWFCGFVIEKVSENNWTSMMVMEFLSNWIIFTLVL